MGFNFRKKKVSDQIKDQKDKLETDLKEKLEIKRALQGLIYAIITALGVTAVRIIYDSPPLGDIHMNFFLMCLFLVFIMICYIIFWIVELEMYEKADKIDAQEKRRNPSKMNTEELINFALEETEKNKKELESINGISVPTPPPAHKVTDDISTVKITDPVTVVPTADISSIDMGFQDATEEPTDQSHLRPQDRK